MKKLLLCLVFAFVIPLVASANNYFYGAAQSSEDPCCINIKVGVTDKNYAGTLIVEIDGVPTYTDLDADNINNIEHCFEGNGIHYVRFYVGDVLYDEYTFDITGCEGECSVCNLTRIELELFQLGGCNYFMDYRLITINDVYGYSPVCDNPTVFWDFGDGTTSDDTPLTNGYFHDFPEDGTYTVCLTFTVTNPNGINCSITRCTDVVVEGCSFVDPCCGLNLDGISVYTHPALPCRAFIISKVSYSTACGPVNYAWTIDDVPVPNNNSNRLLPVFNADGIYDVCLTVTQGVCEFTHCAPVVIFGCTGFTDGGGAKSRSSDWEILSGDKNCDYSALSPTEPHIHQGMQSLHANVYPNPANRHIIFEIGALEDMDAQITLMNSRGQIVRNYTQRLNTGTTHFKIDDLNALSEGIYFYHIQTGSHTKSGKISIFK